jgi:hypothetical protein
MRAGERYALDTCIHEAVIVRGFKIDDERDLVPGGA